MIGVRFLHPVLLIIDVEVTASVITSGTVLDQTQSLLLAMGKKTFYRSPGELFFNPTPIFPTRPSSAFLILFPRRNSECWCPRTLLPTHSMSALDSGNGAHLVLSSEQIAAQHQSHLASLAEKVPLPSPFISC